MILDQACHQLMITTGILFSMCLGLAHTQSIAWKDLKELPVNDIHGLDTWWWRFCLGSAAIPCLITMLGFGIAFKKYESPTVLVKWGQLDKAMQVYASLGTVRLCDVQGSGESER